MLRLLAAGTRNTEIASELMVAVDTVKKQVSRIFDKLGATNMVQAVAHATELGCSRSGCLALAQTSPRGLDIPLPVPPLCDVQAGVDS